MFSSPFVALLNMRFVLITLTVAVAGQAMADSDLRVTVRQGILVGTKKTNRLTKEPYYAFLAVPYAKPPLGEKRFKDPEDPLPWNGILNATQEGSSCMTYDIIFKTAEGDEDCLNLNVYTPKKPSELQESPRAVIVQIPGGAFIFGSGKFSDYGPDFLVKEDIVLVTINYRLNVFGFLSVGNDFVSGNAGLKDQVKALKWVKANIAAFGGNPSSVTIVGQSAGGASVHYLMLSPSAKGLFHRAIAQSGVSLNPWASARNLTETAFKLGEVFDCNTQNTYELVDCLQQVKAKDLAAYQFNLLSMKSTEFLAKNLNLPSVEPKNSKNAFITESPKKIIQSGNFSDVPFLLGVLKFETLLIEKLFSEDIPSSIKNLLISQLNKKPELLLPRNLAFESTASWKRAGLKMKTFYFGDKAISNDTIDNLINETTDSWFLYGIHDAAVLHSTHGKSPVYFYHFVLETQFGESEKAIKSSRSGPLHGDEMKYFFYSWQKEINISPEEKKIISKINRLWINFAKFGNPTPYKSTSEVTWENFTPDKKSYLEIGNEFTMKTNLEQERIKFWENLIAEENVTYY